MSYFDGGVIVPRMEDPRAVVQENASRMLPEPRGPRPTMDNYHGIEPVE